MSDSTDFVWDTCRHTFDWCVSIGANGVRYLERRCTSCTGIDPQGPRFWTHSHVPDIAAVPVFQDNRGDTMCAHCGAREAEYHHWAPRALFPDPELWPGSNLCRTCHEKWHSIVTPQLTPHPFRPTIK
jgi:hypothetical protein